MSGGRLLQAGQCPPGHRLARPGPAHSGRPCGRQRPPRAAPAAADTLQSPVSMEERMAFLEADLAHLFDERGITASAYCEEVEFRDPITSYDNAQGYVKNIDMLKRVFNPQFFLHGIRQTGEYEATTRWTMLMKPTFIPAFMQGLWDPTLTFTGTSVMGVDPRSGKFDRHIDYWDSVENNTYFSLEALGHVLVQISLLGNARPARPPLAYDVLLKARDWEARRYRPFHAVLSGGGPSGADSAQQLAAVEAYLGGRNSRGAPLQKVAPLFLGFPPSGSGPAFFAAPLEAEPSGQGLRDFPQPLDPCLRLATVPARLLLASYTAERSAAEEERAFQQRAAHTVATLDGGGATSPRFDILAGLRRGAGEGGLAACSLDQMEAGGWWAGLGTRWAGLRSVDLAGPG